MKALQKRFGNYQFIELTGTIGYYSLLADDGERDGARACRRRGRC